MKKFILLSTSFVTLIGVYLAYLGITILEYTGHYFTRALEGMLWGSVIILPIIIILAINDSLHCERENKNWLMKETLIVISIIMFIALSDYSFQLLYTFGSMFLLTQIIKYLIFTRYCKIQEKN